MRLGHWPSALLSFSGCCFVNETPGITITAPVGFGTAHTMRLVALGLSAAGLAAAAACGGDVGHGLEGKMIVYGGGGSPSSVFGVI